MPVLSHHFHLSPSDVWALTSMELDAYTRALNQIREAG
jgi:hypothetical protein